MATLPLQDKCVIEFCSMLAGPYAGSILAELGATVIKIENPHTQGDTGRRIEPLCTDGSGTLFHTVNRNKRSLSLDLSSANEREKLLHFIDNKADVIIQSMHPGAIEKLGFDANTLLKRKPRLIYSNISAYGNVGPLSQLTGYDSTLQAYSGLLSITGSADLPARTGVSFLDMMTGMWSAIGILSLLCTKPPSSQGRVDASLLSTSLSAMAIPLMSYNITGKNPGRHGVAYPSFHPHELYATKNSEIILSAFEDSAFKKLALLLNDPRMNDARYETLSQRLTHRETLNHYIRESLKIKTTEEWMILFNSHRIACAPLQQISDVGTTPQVLALGMIQQHLSGLKTCSLPINLAGETRSYDTVAPTLGDFNDEFEQFARKMV